MRPFKREIHRASARKNNYGVTREQYAEMIAKYDVCAICSGPWGKKGPAIDHDHKTNKVRALLCDRCNTGLGLFREDPVIVKEALRYLEFWA